MLDYLEDSILLYVCLDAPTMRSANLLKANLKIALEGETYRYYNYPVNSIDGEQLKIVSVLIEEHTIDDLRDAEAYISRVQKLDEKINELIGQLELRLEKNLILPKFLFPEVLTSIQTIMQNQVDQPNLLVLDFNQKIEKVGIDGAEEEVLKKRFLEVFETVFVPSYQKLYNYLVDLEQKATDDIGAWRWDLGSDYYAFKLKEETSTSLSPEEVYNLGIEEVTRIKEEMNDIVKLLQFKGGLKDFFNFLQTNPQFHHANTSAIKERYLEKLEGSLTAVKTKLEGFFKTKVTEDIAVKPLQNIYQRLALSKKKSDIYYVNVSDMKELPKYTKRAITYQKGIPGEYFQLLIETSLTDLPKFRRLEPASTAYTKGWGMYAAYLAKEMGVYYSDLYSDFGRLSLELWAACHLVVDVGIHQKKWTKQEAIDYYKENTLKEEAECLRMVERHLILPAESLGYKMGMITLLELRKRTELALGTQFNLQEFHEVLLTNGNVPLDVLQDLVEEYIQLKTE
jgi:uncharacterized protein (DUF885 family)